MTIRVLVVIITNRLTALRNQRALAVSFGELQRVTDLDTEIGATEETLNILSGLM